MWARLVSYQDQGVKSFTYGGPPLLVKNLLSAFQVRLGPRQQLEHVPNKSVPNIGKGGGVH